MTVLERVGEIRPDYRHRSKLIQPAAHLALDGAILKWYDIAPAEAPVPPAIHELARRDLQAGELGVAGELGFVILHRCGDSFYFLLVCSWRNQNELWETVWAKDGDEQGAFRAWPTAGAHRPTFCVWELGAVCHEQHAWTTYLRSPRDDAAKQAYVDSTYQGTV